MRLVRYLRILLGRKLLSFLLQAAQHSITGSPPEELGSGPRPPAKTLSGACGLLTGRDPRWAFGSTPLLFRQLPALVLEKCDELHDTQTHWSKKEAERAFQNFSPDAE